MGEMAARDDLEGQGEGIMDEERDTGMAAMSRKDRREHTSGHIRRRQALWRYSSGLRPSFLSFT